MPQLTYEEESKTPDSYSITLLYIEWNLRDQPVSPFVKPGQKAWSSSGEKGLQVYDGKAPLS